MSTSPTQEPQWFLYIVKTENNRLYTGITVDVQRRLAEHQAGAARAGQREEIAPSQRRRGAKALRGKGELALVFQQQVGERSTAQRLEYQVKKLDRAAKNALVAGQIALLDLLPEDC